MATESNNQKKEAKPASAQPKEVKPETKQTSKERASRFVAKGADDW